MEDSSGNLFGTTENGGTAGHGTVFELAASSGTITTLASFTGANGINPNGSLFEDGGGNLFGTTLYGGPSGAGTVFEVPTGTGTITTLSSFTGNTGANPQGGLVEDSSGNLFGTTNGGGYYGDGTVFEVAAGSGTITTLASFNGANGANPEAGLIEDSHGNLFGTTCEGGPNGLGTVFELAAGSGTITTLASFNTMPGPSNPSGPLGYDPVGNLAEDSNGDLFGVTEYSNWAGVPWDETVFEVPAGSGTITTLASFDNVPNDSYPDSGLVVDSQGDLFGTSETDNSTEDTSATLSEATVFAVAQGSGTVFTLASFTGSPGCLILNPLIVDSAGNLFDTTCEGGSYGYGTIFEIASSIGTVTLGSFNSFTGSPQGSLFEDSSGDLFGTTYGGGSSGDGTVFELTKGSGTITTLASFTEDDNPEGGLVENSSGNLFGVTSSGGTYGDGMLFEVTNLVPVITPNTVSLPVNATTLTITGTGFDTNPANDRITFSGGVIGTVTAATSTSLTVQVSGLASLTGGSPLLASVTVDGISSGNAVQVATLAPVVTPSSTWVSAQSTALTIVGSGFDTNPAHDTVTFSGGATGTVTSATATQLSVSQLSGLSRGVLNASVGVDNVRSGSAVQVATVAVAPVFTSPTSATFTVGQNNSLTIITTAFPTATLSAQGPLPSGVTFVNNGNGTATLSGTPVSSTGRFAITVTAKNHYTPAVSQGVTLTVVDSPAFLSSNSTTFVVGQAGSFTITTKAGLPTATTLTEKGALPSGVSFKDNGNGTATLKGTPAAGKGGTYGLTFTASNGTAPDATQSFTLTVDQAPTLTSARSATFVVGQAGAFSVYTNGFPRPTLTLTGTLPADLSFTNNGNGTATLSGTPATGSKGTYALAFTAGNGVGATAKQSFTLTVDQPPSIASARSTTFTVGQAGSFTITATAGLPTATTLTETGVLPSGVSFTDNKNGTATLKGTPAAGKGGTYTLTFTASNGTAPKATQSFTLTVDQARP